MEDPILQYQLPDGRLPKRFDKGRAAFYDKSHGEGEVRYMFSMIKFLREKRPRKSKEELSRIARERRDLLLKRDPDFYKHIKQGRGYESKHRSNT